nr:MAG TPA: restriction alleviation protein [Caudoviricetes sp.]
MLLSCPFCSHKITITLENPVFPRVIFLSLESIYF